MADGVHVSATPVVPWPHDTMGHPPAGGVPFGTSRVPLTATSFPAWSTEWWSSSVRVAPAKPSSARAGVAAMGVPAGAMGSGSGTS